MRANNPVVIPRNHKVEQALEAANSGDLQPFKDLIAALQEPYKNNPTLSPTNPHLSLTKKFVRHFVGHRYSLS